MTDKEKAVVMAYTGICMLTGNKFQIFHRYVEDIMDRPIMTHEMGLLGNVIKEKSKADFIALCEEQELCEDWYDMPSNEMNLEQARQAVKDLRKKLVEHLEQDPCEDAISHDFQIGDEVRIIGSDPIYDDCDVGWVIRNTSERVKTMYVMRNDGSAGEEIKAEWYKTGRHNDMLAEVINALPSIKTATI